MNGSKGDACIHSLGKLSRLAVLDPEQKSLNGLFSLLNMESPKVQKVSHWLSKIVTWVTVINFMDLEFRFMRVFQRGYCTYSAVSYKTTCCGANVSSVMSVSHFRYSPGKFSKDGDLENYIPFQSGDF